MYKLDEYTVSLLHFDDGFKDETGKVWTTNGNPIVSSEQSKFGGKSLYLDGSSNLAISNLSDFDFNSGYFTIDWWEYRTNLSGYPTVFSIGDVDYQSIIVGHGNTFSTNDNKNVCYISSNGASWNVMDAFLLGTIDLNTWNHFALVRNGNKFYGFKNGILSGQITSNDSFYLNNNIVSLGKVYKRAPYGFNGFIDEFRISKIARWTGDFDPKPVKKNCLLRITMNDSSEREYELSISEVEAFITWCDRTVDTGEAYYVFDKAVGSQNSKEYLFFEKIISFEVIEIL
ncbi:LamG-like jellyroll fold domain-containing protein [Anaerosinus massiliensis]|uniref:LamG-like jellyroll fold domain-containing protein n=1 Tax=Massilibacillus massiliensis TaxID=1806837 RepID=UPI000DA5EBE4|nr:LamG-like jellyroll fold domain-containing protein [Massilibacillus massiliensis]